MRALTIIVATADAERLRAALMLAAAQAALGGTATLFLQLDAVALLRPPIAAPRDAAHQDAGLPDLAALLAEAQALGVTLVACQSGLALWDLTLDMLPKGIVADGPIGLLTSLTDADRLLFA
ncbi:DsrE family protein [Sphingobium sp. CR2-8]|uniref:DsrE family protein n=1 Tax=Sphingobium sp. CR2-8 TaxID=1306534 RepID=UPI002DB7C7B8|nr:DsrE family protein [Sphingobium sp. CR2-8]MEC3912078.1 DsrE family protein [Sphingobium sp. CR2-8]